MAALALQAGGVCLVSAQDQGTTPPAPPVNPSSPSSALTPDERSHRRTVEKQVLAADPNLKAEDDNLKAAARRPREPGHRGFARRAQGALRQVARPPVESPRRGVKN